MQIQLQVFLLLLLFIQLLLIVSTIKTKKLSIKYGSFWIFLLILMAIVVIFPSILFKLAKLFGFEVASNMIFLIGFFFLFYIIFMLTISISVQNERIKLLVQEVSLLKESVNYGKKE